MTIASSSAKDRLLPSPADEAPLPIWHPDGPLVCWIVLVFNGFLAFGSVYCFDQPSVLSADIQTRLGIDSFQYNLMYSVYSWSNMVMVLVSGLLVDKLGARLCCLLFTAIILSGQLVFALGIVYSNYYVSLIGRTIFGTGGGSISVVQLTITSFWFKGQQLAFAYGIMLALTRIGSVINFLVTSPIANTFSLNAALFFGVFMCSVSFASGVCYFVAERWAVNITKRDKPIGERRIRWSDLSNFPLTYWILCLACMLDYSVTFPFISNAPGFFTHKWGYSNNEASAIAGLLYDVVLIMSPMMGFVADKIGSRAILLLLSLSVVVVVMDLFALTTLTPIVGMLTLGVTHSTAAATIWPSIALLVPLRVVGSGVAVMSSIQMFGVALWNGFAGLAVDGPGYTAMIILFMCTASMAAVTTIVLVIYDERYGGGVLASRHTGKSAKEEWEEEQRAREPINVHIQVHTD